MSGWRKDGEPLCVVIDAQRAGQLEQAMRRVGAENAAFLYITREPLIVTVLEIEILTSSDFVSRSTFHLEVTDEARARVFKRAHQLGAALGEAHGHAHDDGAAFSPSDIAGLSEFVPHVWWRRRGGPYVALVYSHTDFDALSWVNGPTVVGPLVLEIDGRSVAPTGHTLAQLLGGSLLD